MGTLFYILAFIVLQIILLIPSFFFYKKVLRRFKIKQLNLFATLSTLLLPFLYTFLFILLMGYVIDPYIRSKEFDRQLWYNLDERYTMVNDLIDHQLIGKTKNEVLQMLGEPDGEYKLSEYKLVAGDEQRRISYITPDPDNFAILDHYELVIYFDTNEKVKRVSYDLL